MPRGQQVRGGYVRLRRDPINGLFRGKGKDDPDALTHVEHSVLCLLLRLVDSRDPELACTQAELAALVKLHRSRLNAVLDRLAEAKLIEYRFPKGHVGYLRVLAYDDLIGG